MSKFEIGQYVRRNDIERSAVARVVGFYPGTICGHPHGPCYEVDFGEHRGFSYIFVESVLDLVEVEVGDRVVLDTLGPGRVIATGATRDGRRFLMAETDSGRVLTASFRDIL